MTKEKEVWTMESLMSLTEEIQNEEVEFRGKTLSIQFCELTEEEEPKVMFKDDFESEEERMNYYQELGTSRVLAMITKANTKNSEDVTITEESWAKLPTTLRYQISNVILGMENQAKENFTMG
jgi:hypothetical protein|tara:strand:+ start:714 stop:1082 length:369 start_codon:yes stop_codon:yes gene_type:complete